MKERFDELRDQARRLPALEQKQNRLADHLRQAELELRRLHMQHEKEQMDVEALETGNFSSFVLRLTGRLDERLEAERQEEVWARERYDEAAAALEELKAELAAVKDLAYQARAAQRQVEQELTLRRKAALQAETPEGARYQQLEQEAEHTAAQMVEAEQALGVARRAQQVARRAQDSLGSAGNWATYDVFAKGGLLTHMAKYGHIDDAEKAFSHLRALIKELRTELADVERIQSPQLGTISSSQRAVDFWFDNIFTDLSVLSRIEENQNQVKAVQRKLADVERALNACLKDLAQELSKYSYEQEELLATMTNQSS